MPAALELPPEMLDAGDGPPPPDDFDDFGGGRDDEDEGGDDAPTPGRGWVTLATFWHPAEAHIARLRLEAGGIACVLLDELTAATNVFAIAVGGVKLQVPRAQSAQAARLLGKAAPREAASPTTVLARFGRLGDAKAAACVVEAAGLDADVRPLALRVPRWVDRLAAGLPAGWAARLSPAAELIVPTAAAAPAAAALRPTPFAANLTAAARRL